MHREYTTKSRRKCRECKESLELNSCWPQNIPVDFGSEGWAYFYCVNQSCRYHGVPRSEEDVVNNRPIVRCLDVDIKWSTIA